MAQGAATASAAPRAASVDDAQALAAGRDRRTRLILGIDLGRHGDDGALLLVRLRGGLARDVEQLLVRLRVRLVIAAGDRVDDLVLQVGQLVLARADLVDEIRGRAARHVRRAVERAV